ncbi:MAG: PaaI family thioesterase [Holophaga sp.]|nr:PaaI family thioesterase [Holophaga sp.]
MVKTRSPHPIAPDLLDRVRDRFRDFPLTRDWQLSIDALQPGQATLSLVPTECTVNGPTGVVNGGVLATLADISCALALCTYFDGRMPFATSDLHIRYLEPADRPVLVQASVLRASLRSAILECQLLCEGRMVGLCTAHFTIKSRTEAEK